MEKKTTQRIIGILVVAALIVILLPLLFSGNTTQVTTQAAEVKAPPFPDAAVQSASSETPQPPVTITQNTAEAINNSQPPVNLADNTTNSTLPLVIKNNNPPVEATTPAVDATPPAPVATTEVAPTVAPTPEPTIQPAVEEKPVSPEPQKKAVTAKTAKVIKAANTHPSHKDLVKLKNAAWAVQMGSFKIKSNAEHLVNQLRAHGYKAFTREIKSSTRVYVGPEFKQASAASLAEKIQQKMNMQGIIVSYQPLEL
jgi:DedD protein